MKLKNISIHKVKEIEFEYEDYLSKNKDSREYASVQIWHNGEGFSIFKADNSCISFVWSEWSAFKKAVKILKRKAEHA